jgi:hypothetical protein
MAKWTREQAVKERRAQKQQKKQDAAAARRAESTGTALPESVVDEEIAGRGQ